MKIHFTGKPISMHLKRQIKKAASLSLEHLNQPSSKIEMAITFLSEREMQELNNRTRGINKVTDVLSFPSFSLKPYEIIDENNSENYLQGKIFLGDMAICLNQAESQAQEYGQKFEDEIVKIVIHSTLHMMGFDHISDDDYKVMNSEEEKIASKFYTNKKI